MEGTKKYNDHQTSFREKQEIEKRFIREFPIHQSEQWAYIWNVHRFILHKVKKDQRQHTTTLHLQDVAFKECATLGSFVSLQSIEMQMMILQVDPATKMEQKKSEKRTTNSSTYRKTTNWKGSAGTGQHPNHGKFSRRLSICFSNILIRFEYMVLWSSGSNITF